MSNEINSPKKDGGGTLKVEKLSNNKFKWTWIPNNKSKKQESYNFFDTSADAQRDFMRVSKYFKQG